MVNKFLGWKLPDNFSPDGGISFQKHISNPDLYHPIGTNLFTADQAKEMFEYCLKESAELEPKWISVKDRLPNENTHCIAYMADRGSIILCYFHNDFSLIRVGDDGFSKHGVTHWMYLPELPKDIV